MTVRTALTLVLVLNAGCQTERADDRASTPRQSVYELVISDLAQKKSADVRFVGADVWISPQFSEGDSLLYGWGDEIDIDEKLVDALRNASRRTDEFPHADAFGPGAIVKVIESFHDLHYYGKNRKPVNAKCLIEFWRPGYTDDGKRAIVRFYYGPSPHGAAGTYILRYTDKRWCITASRISYYL